MDGDLYFKQTHDVRTQGLSLFYLNIYAHDSPVLYTVTRFCQKSFETAQKLEMKLFNEEWEKNKKKTFFEARSICNCAVFQVLLSELYGLVFTKEIIILSISDSLWRRANARNVSFRISVQWPIYIINSVDKTKLSCNTLIGAAPQFLWKLTPFFHLR